MIRKDWELWEQQHVWHACAQMKDYESFKPLFIEKGEGVWLITKDNQRILDAVSSWWVNNLGHCNPDISYAITKQLQKLEHVIFANCTHQGAIELSRKLSTLFNHQLPRVFYTDNGSSAVEAALKMSFQYWQQTGAAKKTRFMYISNAYHGETIGALSVSGVDLYKKIYSDLILETIEVKGPDCFRCPLNLNRDTCKAECFSDFELKIKDKADTTCGIIIEPLLQAAAGMKMYPPIYLKKLRKACTEYGIHLLCDEIATGFGRTGTMMACHQADIVPDFVMVSKGLTGGFLPLAAVLTSEKVYRAFYADYVDMKAFLHSHSYTANPLACAAALAVFEVFEKEQILIKNQVKREKILDQINILAGHPHVGEIRNLGMVTAVELVKDLGTKEAFDWRQRIGYQIYQNAVKKGVLLRCLGDVIYFMPPYIINDQEIAFMCNTAVDSINEVLRVTL